MKILQTIKVLKSLFIILLAFGFLACDKDDSGKATDLSTIYTQLQKDAQGYFQGVWVATPVRTKFEFAGQILYTQSIYADTLCFGVAYVAPKVFYRNDYLKGETYNFTAYGECVYKPEVMNDVMECYYSISPEADTFTLYKKDGETLYQTYKLSFENESRFTLQNGIYPYVFNKE